MATIAEMTEVLDSAINALEDLRAVMYHKAHPYTCYGGRLNDARRDIFAAVGYIRNARMDLLNETHPMVGSECGGSAPRKNRAERRKEAHAKH
jgi:hypothetical protein